MKILKYIFSISLVIWGLLIAWVKLFSVGFHFPFLTFLTAVAIILEIGKHKKANLFFFLSSCFWVLLSAETIGFVIVFDFSNYTRGLIGVVPLVLSIGLIFVSEFKQKWVDALGKKLLIIFVLIAVGIGSYVYKPTTEEINCWYYFEDGNSYEVLFAHTPKDTFKVRLSSVELKNEVKTKGIQYQERVGYYCPETQVRVVTCFGKIISARIISFRNSEINKKVIFSSSTKIPLNKVEGKLEILKPYLLRIWN